jgi:hypothetical protein
LWEAQLALEIENKQQELIIQYLLGQARSEDVASLEELLMTDREFLTELQIVEDELIDQYLDGELSEFDRDSFETYFLGTPERQRKVRFGRIFNKYLSDVEPLPSEDLRVARGSKLAREVPKSASTKLFFSRLTFWNPSLSYSLVVALVLIVGTVSWIALRNWRSSGSNDPSRVLAVTLTPGLTRGNSSLEKIVLHSDIGTLRLRLKLIRDDYNSYRVIILDDNRSPVWTGNNLEVSIEGGAKFVSTDLPARSVTSGNYSAKLSGRLADETFDDLDTYPFQLSKP